MLLLYRLCGLLIFFVFFIYIPLCFYFIRFKFEVKSEADTIYIPLCFYFIKEGTRSCLSAGPNLHSTMLLLYLLSYWIISSVFSNLHSTMLLLYRLSPRLRRRPPSQFTFHYASTLSWQNPCRKDRILIYIPLCFYFIRFRQLISGHLVKFTFHYASTLSGFLRALAALAVNLHSTMLLLYRLPMPSNTRCLFNLHSTMLLLYPVPVFPFYFLQYKYTFCLPHFLHISLLKNLPPPTLQNLNFP